MRMDALAVLEILPCSLGSLHILQVRSYIIHGMRSVEASTLAYLVLQLIQLLLEAIKFFLAVRFDCSTLIDTLVSEGKIIITRLTGEGVANVFEDDNTRRCKEIQELVDVSSEGLNYGF